MTHKDYLIVIGVVSIGLCLVFGLFLALDNIVH